MRFRVFLNATGYVNVAASLDLLDRCCEAANGAQKEQAWFSARWAGRICLLIPSRRAWLGTFLRQGPDESSLKPKSGMKVQNTTRLRPTFACGLGEQFEKKWLDRADSLDEDVLSVPDFSTTGDLYGVVGNINKIRIMPVGAVDMYALLITALVPGIPVVLAAILFDAVMHEAVKVLF